MRAFGEVHGIAGGASATGAKPHAARRWESPCVAQLVRLLQTLKLGFAPTPCGDLATAEELRSAAATPCRSLRRHDKELKTEGVFMNTRTKLAIAVGAAIWMVPMSCSLAGIEVNAGDWKIDFAANGDSFYVNAGCDDVPTT